MELVNPIHVSGKVGNSSTAPSIASTWVEAENTSSAEVSSSLAPCVACAVAVAKPPPLMPPTLPFFLHLSGAVGAAMYPPLMPPPLPPSPHSSGPRRLRSASRQATICSSCARCPSCQTSSGHPPKLARTCAWLVGGRQSAV
eukprot:1158244-Pelagomonas_calceolata.AAC.14